MNRLNTDTPCFWMKWMRGLSSWGRRIKPYAKFITVVVVLIISIVWYRSYLRGNFQLSSMISDDLSVINIAQNYERLVDLGNYKQLETGTLYGIERANLHKYQDGLDIYIIIYDENMQDFDSDEVYVCEGAYVRTAIGLTTPLRSWHECFSEFSLTSNYVYIIIRDFKDQHPPRRINDELMDIIQITEEIR